MTIGWEHPEDTLKGWEGINSGDMEWFRDQPLEKYAREGVQNSLDAKLNNSNPVKVEFQLIHVDVESIPNIEELRNNIERALEAYETDIIKGDTSNADVKVLKLYKNALKILSKKTIPVFQISDSNTTGMSWDDTKNNHFFTYIRASSHSAKGDDSGGSFGIGKMAPFVVSGIRTIFASSVYQKDNNYFQVTQGKAVLSSLYDSNGIQRRSIGLWGEKGTYDPVETADLSNSDWIYKSSSVDLTSNDVGTKISALGFTANQNNNWDYEIASSIIMNFFAAIHANKLEVQIGGLVINAKSLNNFFQEKRFQEKILKTKSTEDAIDWEEEFDTTRHYLSTLDNTPNINVISEKLEFLGNCELRLKLAEDLPKRICYIRNGMKITHKLDVSGVKSFSGLMEFVAVFQCLDQKGNEILRSMENPSHNAFDPNRPEDDKERALAHNAIKELASWIRVSLNEHARKHGDEVKDIQELLEFFSWEEEDQGEKPDDEVNPFGEPVKIRVKPAARRRLPKIPDYKPGPIPPEPFPTPPEPFPTPPNPRPGPGPDLKIKVPVAVNNFRFLMKENSKSLKLFFTPEFSGEADLQLFKSEADSKSSNPLLIEKTKNDNINIYVEGERTELEVELIEAFEGSIEILLFQIKEAKS